MNPQWRPLPTPGMAPAPQSMGGSLPTPDFMPMPMQNPRIAQYTKLMQQADPSQRQMLIGHLVDQFNQGNQSVAPYLQDLQAKGLISQQGLTAPSSAPIQRSTPGFTGIGDMVGHAAGAVGNFVNQGVIQPVNRSLVRPIESNLYDIGHGNLSSLTPASSVRNAPTSQGNPFTDNRNQIQRLADNAAVASNFAAPGVGAAEGSVVGNVAKAAIGNALMGSGLSGVQAIGDGATTAQTAQAMKQGLIAGGALGALGGGIGAAASHLHPGIVAPMDNQKGYIGVPGEKLDPRTGEPIVKQPRNEVGQYGNKLPAKPTAFSHLTEDLPAPNPHNPAEVVDAYNNVANRYNTALDHEAQLSRTPAMKKANATTLADLQNVKADLYNEAMAHRAQGLGKLGLTPEDFGMDTRKPGQKGSLDLNGDISGKNEKLPVAKSLHLDEPTPYESVNISDRKAVGSAVGKTQAYLKRIDQALAQDPTNAPLRQRRLQLANDLKQLQSAYRNPVSGEAPSRSYQPTRKSNIEVDPEDAEAARVAALPANYINTHEKPIVALARSSKTVAEFDKKLEVLAHNPNTPDPQMLALTQLERKEDVKDLWMRANSKYPEASPMAKEVRTVRAERAVSKGATPFSYEDYLAESKGAPEVLTREQFESIFKTGKDTAKNTKTDAALAARMEAVKKPTRNQVDLTPGSGGVKSAIANSQMVEGELTRRGEKAYKLGARLNDADKALARQYELGTNIDKLAEQAMKPARFKQAMTALEDYYDYRLAAERAAGAPVPKVDNYLRHYWDLSNPEDAERFNQMALQKGLADFKGVSSQPRVFKSYQEGINLGFKPLHKDVFEDLKKDVGQSRFAVSRAALKHGIQIAAPDEISTAGNGVDANGQAFMNSNIDGLNGMSYSRRVDNELKGFRPLDRNIFGKGFDSLNHVQKGIVLSLSFFHSMNISLNFTAATGFRHPFIAARGLGNSALSFISPRYFEHLENGFRERGVLDWEARNGIAVGSSSDLNITGVTGKIGQSRFNPIAQGHKALFDREIPVMTHYLSELSMKQHIEAGSAEGIKLGQEINNVMGLLNQKMLSRDPNTQKWFSRAMLAPAFTETKYRVMWDSLTKWKGEDRAAGNLARTAVVGKTALEGLIGVTGYLIATGQFPTLQQVIGQAISPHIPTGVTNSNGGKKAGFLPTSFISEDANVIAPLLHGDTSGLKHYAAARLSPNLATGEKLLTNQDYFGNPIIDPNKPVGKQIAGAAISQTLPIGAQNVQNYLNGKKGLQESLLNESGLKVKNDPGDPINQQTAAHFAAVSKYTGNLNKNDLSAYNTINPQAKNPDGSYTDAANFNPFKQADKVYTLLSHPKVLDAMISINQASKNHDPMWDLPKDQLTTFLTYQGIQGTDYGIATAKEIEATNPWIADLNQQRSDWFNTLPKSQNPDGANPIAYPKLDDQTQALMNLESQLTKIPANQRNAWQTEQLNQLYNNPQLKAAYDQLNQYTQDRRAQQNVPQFAQAPVVTPYVQAQMNAGNFRDPYVQSYLNASTAFKASGPFGDGIGGAGGNHNTSAIALANLSQGLTASGKPGAYASSSSSSRNSAARRNLKNEFKYAIKDVKYAGKKMKNNLKYQHHVAGTQLPRVQNQPILTAQQHAARNHAIAKARNASKRHIA